MAGNGMDNDMPECPLCMEPMGLDDTNFYPCACRYQICRFCWHRIRTDENGLCPHCREPYSENPAEYTPLSQEQLARAKTEKRQKSHEKKQKVMEGRKSLAAVRVIQRNLVFVIGLSPRLADPEVLKKNEYFGKYGKIYKVVINNSNVYSGAQGPSVSAYVTYYRNEDASKAIQAVNNAYIDGRYLKASFGTTKYCTYFLRGTQCTKPDCMYLHELGENEASFTKEDMQMGKHQQYETAHLASPTTPAPIKDQPKAKPLQPLQQSRGKEVTAAEDPGNTALPATASWASTLAPKQSQELKQEHSQPHSHSRRETSHSHPSTGSSISSSGSGGSHSHSTSRSSKHSHIHPSHTSQYHKSHPHSARHVTSSTKHGHKSDASSQKNETERSRAGSSNRSGPTSPSSSTGSSGGMESGPVQLRKHPPTRSDSRGSRGSLSSKPATPNLSPKSSLSTSSSSGSLKMDGHVDGETKLSQEKIAVTTGGEKDDHVIQQSGSSDKPLPSTSQSELEEAEVKVLPVATDHHKWSTGQGESTGVKVIEALGSAGSGQFGSLGVSWSTAQAPVLSNPPPNPPEDDLGFDPWDESKRGLADLLETEGRVAGGSYPPSSNRGTKEERARMEEEEVGDQGVAQRVASDSSSWQEEFRALFPNVNISFGGSRQLNHGNQSTQGVSSPSLRHAVETSTSISSLQAPTLSSSFGYSYPLTNHRAAFGSYGNSMSGITGGWPDFSASNGATSNQNPQPKESTSGAKPAPPPGFTAKSKDVPASAIRTHQWGTGKVPGQQLPANLPAGQVVYVPRWGGYVNIQQVAAANPALFQQLVAQQRQQYIARARQQGLLVQGHGVQSQLEPTSTMIGNGHISSNSSVPTTSAVHPGQTGVTSSGLVQNAALGSGMGLAHMMTCTAGQVAAVAPGNALPLQQPGAVYRLVGQSVSATPTAASIARTPQDVQRLNVND